MSEQMMVKSVLSMILVLSTAISGCASSTSGDEDATKPSHVPRCFWELTILVENQLEGNLEIDYYLIQEGAGPADHGTSQVVRPGVNTYAKYAFCEASSFDFRIGAYYAGGETHGPEQQCRFTNPTDEDVTVEFVIMNSGDTSGRVIFANGDEMLCEASD